MALVKCKECGHDVSTTAEACPNCGAPDFVPGDIKRDMQKEQLRAMMKGEKPKVHDRIPATAEGDANTPRILGLIGAGLLFMGVFMPIISLPLIGSINYFNNGNGDGVAIIIIAVLSLVSILAGWYRVLWFTGLASVALLGYTYVVL